MSNEWSTPQPLFNALDRKFHFTLDVCATPDNAKCDRYFSPRDDGLEQDWSGERVWMNPPYGRRINLWVQKAATSGALVVALLPVRTDTSWWHDFIIPQARVKFLRGRLTYGGGDGHARFPSAIVVWRAAGPGFGPRTLEPRPRR